MGAQCCPRRTATVLSLLLACAPALHSAHSPIFYFPGFMMSNLTASISVAGACTQARSDVQLWPPLVSELLAGRDCWYQSIRLDYKGGRFVNGSGASVWAVPYATAPSGSASALATWVTEVLKAFPTYTYGVDLFVMAYDWCLDVDSMAQNSQGQQLAQAILDRTSSSNRAILVGQSLGALVATKLLQLPHVKARVKGLISYAAPFGGAVMSAAARTSGELASLVSPELLPGNGLQFPGMDALIRDVTWHGVQGMASLAMLHPYSAAYAKGTDPVVVRTASRSYRVSQMATLLKDVGDWQLAKTFSQTHTLDKLVAEGPIPGVDVYCVYGVSLSTVRQLVFNVTLTTSIAPPPSSYLYGRGDSVVPFESLRLCDRLTTGTGRVKRIPDTQGKHFGLMADSGVLAYTKTAIAALRQRT